MKWAPGDRLLRSISRKREAPLSNSDRVVSELYFARSRKYLIDTTDMSRFAAKEITVIYLSFTNLRISITLPGGSVSLKGGTSETYSGK
jgi:hypothetical protein